MRQQATTKVRLSKATRFQDVRTSRTHSAQQRTAGDANGRRSLPVGDVLIQEGSFKHAYIVCRAGRMISVCLVYTFTHTFTMETKATAGGLRVAGVGGDGLLVPPLLHLSLKIWSE